MSSTRGRQLPPRTTTTYRQVSFPFSVGGVLLRTSIVDQYVECVGVARVAFHSIIALYSCRVLGGERGETTTDADHEPLGLSMLIWIERVVAVSMDETWSEIRERFRD
jgi:hypothetical protein